MAAQDQQRGLGLGPVGRLGHGLTDSRLEAVDVVGHLTQIAYVPAVRLEALRHVVAVGQLGGAVDGDVVVVVEGEQLPETQVPGQGRRFVGDALHEAAVSGEDEGPVVTHVTAETGPDEPLGDGHADRIAEALAQRTGGHLDSVRVPVFGVARGAAAPLAELADVIEREVVPGQVQHGIEQDRRVPVREDKTVPIRPQRLFGVVPHDARPEHVGQRRQGHGRAGVPGIGLLGGIHGQSADHVDAQLDEGWILHHRRDVRCRSLSEPGP